MKIDNTRTVAFITECSDPEKLKRMAANARRLGEKEIERAASLKLYSIMPSAEPGTLEYDVWRSIYALEGALKDERGKTIMLGRTRQKIARDGEAKTVADLVLGTASDGLSIGVQKGPPIGVQKRPPLSGSVTVTDAPFALVAAEGGRSPTGAQPARSIPWPEG